MLRSGRIARVVGVVLLLAALGCSPSARTGFSSTFWRGDGTADAKAALARGDSQYVMLHLPDSSRIFLSPTVGNVELDMNAIRHVQLRDLGIDTSSFVAHKDSITQYLQAYNFRMLRVRILQAICGPGDKDSVCADAAS
jgi:hypothetical protein